MALPLHNRYQFRPMRHPTQTTERRAARGGWDARPGSARSGGQPARRSVRSSAGSSNQVKARSCFVARTARGSRPTTTSRTNVWQKVYSSSPVAALRPPRRMNSRCSKHSSDRATSVWSRWPVAATALAVHDVADHGRVLQHGLRVRGQEVQLSGDHAANRRRNRQQLTRATGLAVAVVRAEPLWVLEHPDVLHREQRVPADVRDKCGPQVGADVRPCEQ